MQLLFCEYIMWRSYRFIFCSHDLFFISNVHKLTQTLWKMREKNSFKAHLSVVWFSLLYEGLQIRFVCFCFSLRYDNHLFLNCSAHKLQGSKPYGQAAHKIPKYCIPFFLSVIPSSKNVAAFLYKTPSFNRIIHSKNMLNRNSTKQTPLYISFLSYFWM